jgi:type IV pilus assembly protein PilP
MKRVVLLFVCLVFVLQGAGWAEQEGQASKGIVAKEVIKYDPAGRRDPFLSIIAITKQKIKKMAKKRRSLNPLENYDLTDIKLLGIVYDGKQYYASVLLPDGKGFTVKEGMRIGINGGKIIKLLADRMIVREYLPDIKTGKLKPRDTILKLHKEEE